MVGLSGPLSDPEQLLDDAGRVISGQVGPQLALQDRDRRPSRLPKPPLVAVDRAASLDAALMSTGTGTVRTQTDV